MTENEKKEVPRGLYERLKSDDTSWELWAQIGVALFLLLISAFIVAYLRLGKPSLYAHSLVIPLLGAMTLPLAFWGLLRTIFRPPIYRLSRTIGFGALVLTGFFGNQPLFPAPVSTEDWTTDKQFYLPFDGKWVTLAGGDDKKLNHHATTPAHRWGYDFAPLVEGRRYRGDGTKLEDHHCYGAPVRAPVAGTVVRAVGNEPDQPPDQVSAQSLLGNNLVIRIDTDEYLFLTNLRQGSLRVGSQDEVQPGQVLAECGNSGHSITPHLHIHLQNSPDFPIAESLPLRFSDYLADGESVSLGMPQGSPDMLSVVGQVVQNQRPWDEK